MLKKKSYYICFLIIGLALLAASCFFRGEEVKAVAGILLGIGAGLVGMSFANLYMKHYEDKHPEIKKQNEIDYKDERNASIRNKAKAKAGDIIQWLIIGMVYILIIIDAPLWVSLIPVGIFLLYHILGTYYMSKYQKEM